jgi:reactive intermediate/imine deaminase
MKKEILNPESVFKPAPTWSQGVKVGNTVYLAGQTGYDREGKIVGKGDIVAQATQAFENMRNVLKAAGGNLANVVKVTYYARDIEDYNKVRAEVTPKYFTKDPPAAAAVIVHSLVFPEILIEIEAIAVIE